jgi:hypothetical protein
VGLLLRENDASEGNDQFGYESVLTFYIEDPGFDTFYTYGRARARKLVEHFIRGSAFAALHDGG